MAKVTTRLGAGRAIVRKGSWRRHLIALVRVMVVLAIFAPLYVDVVDHRAPQAVAGTLTFTSGSTLPRPIRLGGVWQARRLDTGGGPFSLAVPGQWRGQPDATGTALPGQGIIRYSLTVRGLAPGTYVLYVPALYEATRISVDGRVVAGTGVIGHDGATTTYHLRASEATIVATGKDVAIALDIAAFHHRDTGIETAPVLGNSEAMRGWTAAERARNVVFTGTLILIALFGFIIYSYRREDRPALLLGCAFAALVPVDLIFAYDNLVGLELPGLSFAWTLALQYCSLALALLLLCAYVSELFPAERFRWAQRGISALLIGVCVTQIGLAAAGMTVEASIVAQWTELLRLSSFVYLIVVAVRATWRGRDGAVVFLFGVASFVVLFALRTLYASGFLHPLFETRMEFLSLGGLAFLFAQIVIMAERWALALQHSERMTDDQRQLVDISRSITSEVNLDALLGKIVAAASAIVRADRSSLFLHDAERGELWSVIAEGVDRRIGFPATAGLAGDVFTGGKPANVANAYADPRFNTEVDEATGYRTRSVLTVPIEARDGRKLGVLQALNPVESDAFDDSDITRLTAFAAQAAIAIDNARLFSEVVTERNYSNSILGSMSAGVITIEAGHRHRQAEHGGAAHPARARRRERRDRWRGHRRRQPVGLGGTGAGPGERRRQVADRPRRSRAGRSAGIGQPDDRAAAFRGRGRRAAADRRGHQPRQAAPGDDAPLHEPGGGRSGARQRRRPAIRLRLSGQHPVRRHPRFHDDERTAVAARYRRHAQRHLH